MFLSGKKSSMIKNSEIFLSNKHIITEEQLSELCSQSKQSRSSNLLEIVTRTKHKLNTVSKRSNQPEPMVAPVKRSQSQHANQHKKQNKQNEKEKEFQQMNRLYQENQKLGYRINYLNDQNNFYRISINNIEKLNSNIHKQLDGHQMSVGVKNKINTKAVMSSAQNSVSYTHNPVASHPQNSHKLSLNTGKGLSSHAQGHMLARGMASNMTGNSSHPLATGLARRSMSRVGSMVPVNPSTNNASQQYQQSTPQNELQQGIKAGSGISSSFSQISNKIHLKNLQMKVGNSIRKTQKLKKIYQGSISSLSKKAQQLQTQINKLSRQAEYYQIQSQLLNNIYKADYYMHLNEQWLQIAASNTLQNPNAQSQSVQDNRLDSLKQVTQQDQDLQDDDSDDDYIEYLKKDSHMIPKPKHNHKKISALQTVTSNKLTSVHCQNPNDFRLSKNGSTSISNKKNILMKQMNIDTLPMAVRFMSGSQNQSKLGNTFKNSWYSALYNPKNRANKLSQLMVMHKNCNDTPQTRIKRTTTSNNSKPHMHITPSFLQPNPNNHEYPNTERLSHEIENQPKHMTEKQMFLLPHEMIKLIISSLQKQEIQQVNKLESLRKQEREQRKKNYELIEGIEQLSGHKDKLKALIEQEFSLFFMNNINTMETISSFSNTKNNTIGNKGTTTSGNSQSTGTKLPFGHSKQKPRTLHRVSSTLKIPHGGTAPNNSNKPTPWLTIQQRKQQADQLYMCSLYQKQLLQSIQKQDQLLQEQYKINQEYKQKIIDRNEQQNKELKVLQEEVNKCMEQVKEIKVKYKTVCQAKGKYIGSHSSMATSANAIPNGGKAIDGVFHKQG